MNIDHKKCDGCLLCLKYCPVNAIYSDSGKAAIDLSLCCECGACSRKGSFECPNLAIYQNELTESGKIARNFSDPSVYHPKTRVPGRGTEEVKTNDVTGIVKRGEVGISIEIGRPCLGAKFSVLEEFDKVLRSLGVNYVKQNPLYSLIDSSAKEGLADELKKQHLISAVIQFKLSMDMLGKALEAITEVASKIDTVFSLSMITRLDPGNTIPVDIHSILEQHKIKPRPNAKINLGFGKPLINK